MRFNEFANIFKNEPSIFLPAAVSISQGGNQAPLIVEGKFRMNKIFLAVAALVVMDGAAFAGERDRLTYEALKVPEVYGVASRNMPVNVVKSVGGLTCNRITSLKNVANKNPPISASGDFGMSTTQSVMYVTEYSCSYPADIKGDPYAIFAALAVPMKAGPNAQDNVLMFKEAGRIVCNQNKRLEYDSVVAIYSCNLGPTELFN